MVITNGAQKWWPGTGRPPIDRLAPLDLDALDSIALEKAKDALGNIVGGIGSGRARISPDPDDDRTRSLLPVVVSMGNKASHVNGRVTNTVGLQQVTNQRTHSLPYGVEWSSRTNLNVR
jgi:hypothetical protein